jgi:hypothetical protein
MSFTSFRSFMTLEVDAMIPRSFCTRRLFFLLVALLAIPAAAFAQPVRSWAVHYDKGVYQGGSGCSSSFFSSGASPSRALAADAAGNSYFTGLTNGATVDFLTVK